MIDIARPPLFRDLPRATRPFAPPPAIIGRNLSVRFVPAAARLPILVLILVRLALSGLLPLAGLLLSGVLTLAGMLLSMAGLFFVQRLH